MNPDRPPILTERGFDRRLAKLIAIAFAIHALAALLVFAVGKFQIRPQVENEAYTVSLIDGGELGGHLPSGLPDVNIGPSAAKRLRPIPAQKKPPAEKPPEVAKPEPPPAAAAPQPPPPPPEPPAPKAHEEPAPPVEVAKNEPPRDPNQMVMPTAMQTPPPTAAPTARPTPPPTARPTAAPTARPTARPTPVPTHRPEPTATPRAAAAAGKPSPTSGRPTPTPGGAAAARGAATPTPGAAQAGKAKPSPTASPAARDSQIADALARVQARVKDNAPGREAPPNERSGPTANAAPPGGGVGGTDAPDARRGIGIGPGAGGAGKVRGVEFLLYYNQMLNRIRSAWVWAGSASNLQVRVHFRVAEDGQVVDLRVVEPSGDGSYDASVLRAVRAVSPLPAPPAAYRNDFADVELTFQPSDLKQQPG